MGVSAVPEYGGGPCYGPPGSSGSTCQLLGIIGTLGPPPNPSPVSVVNPATRCFSGLTAVPAKPSGPTP